MAAEIGAKTLRDMVAYDGDWSRPGRIGNGTLKLFDAALADVGLHRNMTADEIAAYERGEGLASRGGKAAHAIGTAHEFDSSIPSAEPIPDLVEFRELCSIVRKFAEMREDGTENYCTVTYELLTRAACVFQEYQEEYAALISLADLFEVDPAKDPTIKSDRLVPLLELIELYVKQKYQATPE